MPSIAVAEAFVKEKLHVELVDDKSLLLNKIVRAFFEKIPNQNISTTILPAEDRFPTEQDVLDTGNSLKGGTNVHNNWFLKLLLEALNYEVHFVAARLYVPPSPTPRKLGSHFAIVVKDLNRPGDLHLVDVGSGSPIFKAVPLNFLPYTATDVNLTYRFIEEDGQWHSEHKDADGEADKWERFASYDKKPVTKSPSDAFRSEILEYLKEDWIAGSYTAIHYPQPGSSAIPDVPDYDKSLDYAISIINDKITFVNSSGFKFEEHIPEDLTVRTFGEYFPNIPKADVERKLEILTEQSAQMRY